MTTEAALVGHWWVIRHSAILMVTAMRLMRLLGETLGVVLLVGGLFLACSRPRSAPPSVEEPTGPAWFADVTAAVGLDFVHDPGRVGHFFMPQIMGAGAALFDFDND